MSVDDRRIPTDPVVIPLPWLIASIILALVGLVAFVSGLLYGDRLRVWQAYLFNYFYWTGLSFGSAVFLAALNITNATWGRPFKRLAEALTAFLPVSFVLLWVIYCGRTETFEWVTRPLPEKAAWLNVPCLFGRDGAAHLILTALSAALVLASVGADRRQIDAKENGLAWRTQQVLSPLIGIVYAVVLSLLAVDLLMSLDQSWYSTMFPAYIFVSGFFSSVAAVYLLTFLAGRRSAFRPFLGARQYHDLGKLTLAFAIFTGYLYYAQFLVIWYGNLAEETKYLITRTKTEPWCFLSWTVLGMIFLIPFFVLLSRRVKLKRLPMLLLTVMILIGMWLERFLLVAPSLWRSNSLPLGVIEISIGLGFLGLMAFCFLMFLRQVPPLPVGDPLFQKFIETNQTEPEP